MATARSARAGWLVATVLAAGCFKDDGLTPLTSDGSTTTDGAGTAPSTSGSPDPSTGAATTAPTTSSGSSGEASTEPAAVCGNNVIEAPIEVCDDGNMIDTDACRSDCQPAECGDGVVWEGKEECDDGPNNHPTLPSACRPTCVLPRCGDGAIYVGPLGMPIDVGGGPGPTFHSDDAPRAIGALADNTFRVLWRSDADIDSIFVQALAADGQPTGMPFDFLSPGTYEIRDPVLAVSGAGDLLIGWEAPTNGGDIRVRGMVAGDALSSFVAHQATGGAQDSASLALSDAGAAVVAYVSNDNIATRVFVRVVADMKSPGQSPSEQAVSTHVQGVASSPTVAMRAGGEFLVAWGDPSGTIMYRRFTADGTAGALVTTTLRVGGGVDATTVKQWTGAALRPDGTAAIGGLDVEGHLALYVFDAADTPVATVQVADVDARFVPFVDIASDPWGNLAVVWTGCGAPGDAAPSCSTLPQVGAVRWFFADLTPFGPPVSVLEKPSGTPTPLGLAVAPSGTTAITYVGGTDVFVRVAPVQCP